MFPFLQVPKLFPCLSYSNSSSLAALHTLQITTGGATLAKDSRLTDSKLKLTYDRRSVSQSVSVSGSHLEPMTKFFYSVWQLQVYCCGAPSLMRGRVSNLLIYLLLGLARAVMLRSKSWRTETIFYCPIWDSPNLEGQVPVFISPRNRVAQLYPGHWVPFLSPLTTRRV
jgi:hypothetical protein